MKKTIPYPKDVFTSLNELLGMEHLSSSISLLARRQKSKSILGGRHASIIRGRGLEFEEVRQYVKGDDIRTIDWKVTARTHTTHTRVFTEEKEKPGLVITDQTKSMFFGSQKRTKSVVAAELAALAAYRILKQGDRVGGIVFADNGIDILQPKRDRRNILRFLEKVVNRNHELAGSSGVNFENALREVIARTRNIVTHDFLVVIISDFHRYSPEVVRAIALMAQHNDIILAKVSDPMEREIPRARFVAGNEQTQVSLNGKQRTLRERLASGFEEDFQRFKDQMKKYQVPLFEVDTVRPLDQQLKELFKRQKR